MRDITKSYLITKDIRCLDRQALLDCGELAKLGISESDDGYSLPGNGSLTISEYTLDTKYDSSTMGDFLSRHISAGRPESAAEWVKGFLNGCTRIFEFRACAENHSSQNAVEAVRSAVWSKLGGIWYFENEWFTNESAAAVLLEIPSGTAGRLTVATLYKGAWVEYVLSASNPAYIARFFAGELPPGTR